MIQVNKGTSAETWYPRTSDYFLRDTQGSGIFQGTTQSKSVARLASIIYVEDQPYSLALSKDLKILQFSPYTGPVKTVALKPPISNMVLGWEKAPGQWEVLALNLKDGKAVVPDGSLRVNSLTLSAKATDGSSVQASCGNFGNSKTFTAATAASAFQEMGQPLSITLSTDTVGTQQSPSLIGALLNRGASSKTSEDLTLRLSLTIQGASKEKYSSFLTTTASGSTATYGQKPRWEVLGPDGKQIATGSFEFG